MIAQVCIDHIRRHLLRDKAVPPLWPDELLLLYLNEAVTLFAKGVYSSTVNQNYDIDLSAGEADYALPEEVLHILSGRIESLGGDMGNYTHRVIPSHLLTVTGQPVIYALDESAQSMRVYPVPDKDYVMRIRAAVLPPAFAAADNIPIPGAYHLRLSEYVVAQCLSNNEIEAVTPELAAVYESRWGRTLVEAKRDIYRFRMGSNAAVRQNWTGKR